MPRDPTLSRRALLRAAGVGAGGLAASGTAAASDPASEATDGAATEEPPAAAPDGSEAYQPKITTLRYPLAGVPAMVEAGGVLRVEVDVDAAPTATLRPSFGGVRPETTLERQGTERAQSAIWPDRDVSVARFAVPELSPRFRPDLFDLSVSWSGGSDGQPRAVSVRETIPEELSVVAIADPQVGDPRAMQSGGRESRNKRSPDPFVRRTRETVGPEERWGAFRQVVREVNLADPDLVLVAGDLTLGQDAPGKYYYEYEVAYDLLNRIRAPTYTVLGNHDGYVQSGTDGKQLYRETFAPFHYSVDVGDLHLVALDTYDWSYLDRFGASFAVSTYGGQVRDDQLAWLREDLADWENRSGGEGSVVVLGHHDPSWLQDQKNRIHDETDGTPAAEQVARGSRYVESGQLWTGENRLAVRDLLRRHGVDLVLTGHSHRDRLARAVGGRDLVETPGPNCFPGGEYHYVRHVAEGGDCYEGSGGVLEEGYTQDELASMLVAPDVGPLYAGLTTVASSTGEYWGLRPFELSVGSGVDPRDSGYPMTDAFLQERAVSPGAWNPDHDRVGLYAHPSYLLSATREAESDRRVAVTVENARETPASGAVVVTLADCPGVRVRNGEAVWRRRAGDRQDVKVAYALPAADGDPVEREVVVECASAETATGGAPSGAGPR